MIEFQEYLYILQKVVKIVDPNTRVDFRNSNTVSKTKTDKSQGKAAAQKIPPEKKKDPIAHWETIGFRDKQEWNVF